MKYSCHKTFVHLFNIFRHIPNLVYSTLFYISKGTRKNAMCMQGKWCVKMYVWLYGVDRVLCRYRVGVNTVAVAVFLYLLSWQPSILPGLGNELMEYWWYICLITNDLILCSADITEAQNPVKNLCFVTKCLKPTLEFFWLTAEENNKHN